MGEWDKVAAIVALSVIPFTVWAALHTLIPFLVTQYHRAQRKPKVRCDRLLWQDVPGGDLHECSVNCTHTLSHQNQRVKCWEGLFPIIFTRAWLSQSRRNAENYRPDSLPAGEEFIEIDFRILMAFIISTIGCNENIRSIDSGFSVYRGYGEFVFDAGGAERVQLKFYDGYVVAHLWATKCRPWTPTGDKTIRPWTKVEIGNLLSGYPPFYTETISLDHGHTRVPFPINTVDDIKRGGWVLAVKLGEITSPLPVYFESQSQTANTHRKPTFQLATEWVRDLVREPFTRSFPGDKNVIAASKALEALCNGQRYTVCALEGSDLSEDAPSSLSRPEAVKAMEIFNRPTLMTAQERQDLRADAESILVPLLSAAVFGVKEVLRFETECVDFVTKLPPALRPSSRIFVRDCSRHPSHYHSVSDVRNGKYTESFPRGGGW